VRLLPGSAAPTAAVWEMGHTRPRRREPVGRHRL